MCPSTLLLLALIMAFVTFCRTVIRLLPLAAAAFLGFIDLCCMIVVAVARLAMFCFRLGEKAAPLSLAAAPVEARRMKVNRTSVPSFGRVGRAPVAG